MTITISLRNLTIALFLVGCLLGSNLFSEPIPGDQNRDVDLIKQDKITFATRAPTAADNGFFWVKYTANSDTTMTFYVRHPKSGTWRAEDIP